MPNGLAISPRLPGPGEIAEVALAGVELGASIVHNHNDEPMFTPDGVHAVEPYLASWRPVLERHPDLPMYPTMAAGARGIPVERRWAHVEELARLGLGGMTLVDPGSAWKTGPVPGSSATWTCCASWSTWSSGWGASRPRSATSAASSASARRRRDRGSSRRYASP